MMRAVAAAGLLLIGCSTPKYAVLDGKRVERPSVGYVSDYFRIAHERAFPGVFDPRRGRDVDDGTIRGRVCGIDLDFDVSWYGDRLALQGRGDVPWLHDWSYSDGLFRLEVHVKESAPGHRHIVAHGPGAMGTLAKLEIDVSDERLEATVASRHYALAADGDYLFGRITRESDVYQRIDAPYAIYGREVLPSMVPADQALVLLLMLACDGPTIEHDGQMVRGFAMVPVPPKL